MVQWSEGATGSSEVPAVRSRRPGRAAAPWPGPRLAADLPAANNACIRTS